MESISPSQTKGKGKGKGKRKKKTEKLINDQGKRYRYWEGAKASWQKGKWPRKSKWN